jgi:hypothetical protein
MNPAPAELLQLLKSAALQLSSSPTTETTEVRWSTTPFTSLPARARKEKAAMPELIQAMRLVLFAKLTRILNESASHFRSVCFALNALKNRRVHVLTNSIT